MKKIFILIAVVAFALVACNNDEKSTWDKYAGWREENNAWLARQAALLNDDGTPRYQRISPDWNPGQYVLLRFISDPAETAGNLSPIYTSTIDVRYHAYLYDGTPVDSSTTNTDPAPGIYRTQLRNLVQGWAMGLPHVHCGDSVELIVPYAVAYGETAMGVILPYSAMRFNIRLVDIPYYEAPPYGE